MSEPEEVRTVYSFQDGEFVPTWECYIGETTFWCEEDGEFAFEVLDPVWVEDPLPDGMLADVTPYGLWVIDGDEAVPVDSTAQFHSPAPLSIDEFEDMVAGGSPWPLWIGLAVVALVGILVWRLVASRRRAKRAAGADGGTGDGANGVA